MAGDWIKMRVGLTTNPKVMRLAECLLENRQYLDWSALSYGMGGYPPPSEEESRSERHAALRVTRYVTVTALLRFWGYANEHIKGEFVAGIFPEDVDEIVGVPGFADAIEAAGWAEFDPDGGMTLPNFAEHNTSAGERSGGAERQKRYREKQKGSASSDATNSDVTRDVTVTPREEKRREEDKSNPADADLLRASKGDSEGRKSTAVEIDTWLSSLDGDAIPASDPIFAYAESAGIPVDFLELSWLRFVEAMRDSKKRQKDWRAHYRNAVKGNWHKLWWFSPEGDCRLTTAGEQAKRARA